MFKKILSFYTRYFAIWVVFFGAVAYVWPGPFVALKSCNKLFFSLTMFGIGAVLRIEDFERIAQRPVIVLIGSAAQFTIMPIGGYAVGAAFNMETNRKRTLAIEIGMQNAGLGTVLALEHFGEKAAMPAAIFVFVCIITASVMAAVWQKRTVEAK